jgi:MFS transporter, PAT family, beta-lactamase induction signal transducer AmpG
MTHLISSMRAKHFANHPSPVAFALAMLPAGIAMGFLTIALPFVARRAGLSVVAISSIIAVGVMPLVLSFSWCPVVDLTLTYKRWCSIGTCWCAAMLVLLSWMPLRPTTVGLVSSVAFVLMTGTTFIAIPVSGLIAYGVPNELKGKASGGFQVGNTGGMGVGGAAGVWLAAHFSAPMMSGVVLALMSLACLVGLSMIPDAARPVSGSVVRKIVGIGRELWELVRQPRGALVVALVMTPIGVGAASNLWSAVAEEWQVSADTVAFVTGIGGACVTVAGCIIGGWWADRTDRRVVYLGGGGILAVVGIFLAITPRNPVLFTTGTLSYTMTVGICNTAFSALLLSTIGRGAAASKCAIVAAVGNLPLSYMTAFDGWVHDHYSSATMLMTEAAVCVLLIVATAVVIQSVRALKINPPKPPAT